MRKPKPKYPYVVYELGFYNPDLDFEGQGDVRLRERPLSLERAAQFSTVKNPSAKSLSARGLKGVLEKFGAFFEGLDRYVYVIVSSSNLGFKDITPKKEAFQGRGRKLYVFKVKKGEETKMPVQTPLGITDRFELVINDSGARLVRHCDAC